MSNMNLTKRIGNTSFKVSVYFSEKATETMEEKVLRIIQNHLADGEKCDIMNVPQMSRSA